MNCKWAYLSGTNRLQIAHERHYYFGFSGLRKENQDEENVSASKWNCGLYFLKHRILDKAFEFYINPHAPVAQKSADEVVFRRFQREGVEFF